MILLTTRTKYRESELEQADWRQAEVLCKIHNSTVAIVSALAGKKVGKQLKTKDFMPKRKQKKKNWREMKETLENWLRG